MKGISLQRQYAAIIHSHEEMLSKRFDIQYIPWQEHVDHRAYGRWQLYVDSKKIEHECSFKFPVDLKCKTCKKCGLYNIDERYSVPCHEIMRIGEDLQ